MNENRGTLEVLTSELAILLAPLTNLSPLTARLFLSEIGLILDDAQANSIAPALTKVVDSLSNLINLDFELSASIDVGSADTVVSTRVSALTQVTNVITSFEQLATALSALGLPDAAPIIADFPKRLFDFLLSAYLGRSDGISQILEFAGVLEKIDHNVDPFDAKPFYTTQQFHLDRISGWLRKPHTQLANLYGWGSAAFDGKGLFAILDRMLTEAGMPSILDATLAPVVLDGFWFRLLARPDLNPKGIELGLGQGLSKGVIEWNRAHWTATASLDADLPPDTRIVIQPGSITVKPPDATKVSGKLSAAYGSSRPPEAPFLLLSFLGICSMTLEEIAASAGLQIAADGTAQVVLSADLKRGKIKINTDKADGFIAKILSAFRLESNFDIGLDYSLADGLHFRGSSALEVELASHMTLGPIQVNALTLSVGINDNAFPIAVTAEIQTSFGPLTAVVKGLGFAVDLSLAADNKGNVGPLNVTPRFQPPSGVALAMDGGGFKGGGFLFFDSAKEEYAGGLELDFQGIVTVKAVGLLSTRFPDGHRGFSLLIIISAEFPPIQLGLGFTLLGVGGLLGLSRTVDEDSLREGVHQGTLDSILFPVDVVANASRIVNDLQRVFPPLEDHFLIGPMVKFGWGTPTILSLEFGIILDIPRPAFMLIGRLRAGLPFQDLPLFDIKVAFAGGVDFELGQLWFDASLYDSRLLAFALTGDMAVRLYWKENANFILTVGGFHPSYTPPPMALGTLQRLGITIFDGNPRLRAETYFAVTSNTVQWGAKAELYFGVDAFNVYGFIAYDVLIQFDPFRFIATLSAMLAVRSGSEVLLGIRIDALLEGPTPWHAKGTGHFEISFIITVSIDVDFEVTIGDSRHDTLPQVNVLPQLVQAFGQPANWHAVLPAGTNLQVTVRSFEPPADTIVLHPVGSLEITEKVVPLNLPVELVGTQHIGDGSVFRVEQVTLGVAPGQLAPVRQQFAPAQFIEMSDAEKLSSRSFEDYEAGVQVGGGDAANADYTKTLQLEYEVIYIPEHPKRAFFKVPIHLFTSFAVAGAVSQSPLSSAKNAPSVLGPQKVAVGAEQFAVASTTDLTIHNENLVFLSEAEARAAMKSLVTRDPSLHDTIQVVPLFLVKEAA